MMSPRADTDAGDEPASGSIGAVVSERPIFPINTDF
jgi:hypothetical protein